MKKYKFIFIIGILSYSIVSATGIVPKFHGARSLALGNSSTAFVFDINMLDINPSYLSSISFSMTGYQYQQSYNDLLNFFDKLNDVIAFDIQDFNSLSQVKKQEAWESIKELYSKKNGLYGFKSQNPGFIGKNFGISISFEKETIMNTVKNEILSKDISEISNKDIDTLKMNFLGLSYKKFSIGYGMNFSQDINVGVTLNYLSGTGNSFQARLNDVNFFNKNNKIDSYMAMGWEETTQKFSKIIMDFGANMALGQNFRIGAVLKNYGNPVISIDDKEIEFKQRIIAGLAFRPSRDFNIYLDADIKKNELIYGGEEMQPISFGIEKGFFNNKIFLRAGVSADLATDYLFGKKSNSLYGFGLGFNMKKILIDGAIGLDKNGKIINIAISAFIITQ